MKKLILILLVWNSFNTYSQVYKPIFYNGNWELTQRKFAVYFRTSYLDTSNFIFIGPVKDYYIDGKPEMEGQNDNNGLKTDTFRFYHKNGTVKCYGNYVNDVKDGKWKYFYPDGKLKQIIEYSLNDFIVHEYNDSTGNNHLKDRNGDWETSYYFPITKDIFTIKGQFVDGLKDGKWICYVENESLNIKKRIQYVERYEMGKFLKGKWYWGGGGIEKRYCEYQNKTAHEDWKFNQIYHFKRAVFVSKTDYPFLSFLGEADPLIKLPVDKHAHFPGGKKALNKFIKKKLRYPEAAKKKKIETTVLLKFLVKSDGSITNIKCIINSDNEEIENAGFDYEVTRLVEKMPDWIPAERDNVLIDETVSILIEFTIIKNNPITKHNIYTFKSQRKIKSR